MPASPAMAPQPTTQTPQPRISMLPGTVTELPPLQFAGLTFALFTLVAILLVTGLLLLRQTASPPALPTGITLEQIELQERWAKLHSGYSKEAVDRTLQLAQIFITGTLLPVLTAVLGYLFGKRED